MVPKRDIEAMKEDAEHEAQERLANSPLASNPLFQGLRTVMGTLKEFGQCVKECVRTEANGCFTGLGYV